MTSRRKGQAIIEMALVLPVLLMVVLGIIEFGRAWNTKQVITEAAREGVRLAVVEDPNITQDSVRTTIRTLLGRSGIPPAATTISFDDQPVAAGGKWRKSDELQTMYVAVVYRFGFFGPLIKAINGTDQITIATVVTMRNE
jgi:Flp pilus assembly protein TadG